jgi:hypothetical protein
LKDKGLSRRTVDHPVLMEPAMPNAALLYALLVVLCLGASTAGAAEEAGEAGDAEPVAVFVEKKNTAARPLYRRGTLVAFAGAELTLTVSEGRIALPADQIARVAFGAEPDWWPADFRSRPPHHPRHAGPDGRPHAPGAWLQRRQEELLGAFIRQTLAEAARRNELVKYQFQRANGKLGKLIKQHEATLRACDSPEDTDNALMSLRMLALAYGVDARGDRDAAIERLIEALKSIPSRDVLGRVRRELMRESRRERRGGRSGGRRHQ